MPKLRLKLLYFVAPYLKTQNLFKRMSQKTRLYLAIVDTKNENSDIAVCRRLMADQFIKEIVRQCFLQISILKF